MGTGERRPPVPLAIVIFAPIALLNILWFTSFSGRSLMGDDLDLLLQSRMRGGYASSFLDSFTQAGADKFRPVLTVVLSIVTDIFGSSFLAYRTLNLGLQLLNVGLTGLLVWRLTRRNWLISAVAMTLVTVSRFNVYFVLQVLGLMESVAVTFLLGMMLAVHRAYETQNRRPFLIANFLFLLVVFTHERFIVLVPFLVVATVLAPGTFHSARERLCWSAVPVAVAGFNVGVKVYGLGIEFFTGPGGQEVDLGPGQILVFFRRAFLNICGFNTGPDYLSGRNMHSLGAVGLWLGIGFILAICVVCLLVIVDWKRRGGDRQSAARAWLLGASLLTPLLLSASITFRQEFRWLYAPYVVLIVGLGWILGRLSPRLGMQMLATLSVLATGSAVDGYYRGHVENTYFFGGLRVADNVRREVVDRHRGELASSTVFLVTHGDAVVEDWYLRSGGFFDVYAPGSDVRLVESLTAVQAPEDVRPRQLAFELKGERVVEVTSQLETSSDSVGSAVRK